MEVAMKKPITVVVSIVVPLFLFGCAAPKVRYHAEDNINKNYIPFALLASRATIVMPDQVKDDEKDEKKVAALRIEAPNTVPVSELKKAKIIVTPAQAQKTLRYLEPQDDAFSSTNISVTYFEAMKVPKAIGVVVEDNTLKVLSALGAVGTAIATIAAAAVTPFPPELQEKITLPIVLDFSDPEDFSTFYREGKEVCKPIGGPNKSYGYCFKLAEREGRKTTNDKKERYTYKTFFVENDKSFTRKIPFSGCVDLTIALKKWDRETNVSLGEPLSIYNSVIADPYYVDWLPLPQKGTITSQSTCGANSTSEKSANPGAFELIEAVGKQVDAVWKAWHPHQ
jgi:hypothetical protein